MMGQGPAVVLVPGWISHLQLQWEPPAAQLFLQKVTRYHTFITYDRYGCGLSERNRTDFSSDSEVRVLEAVVGYAELKRFALLGFSYGGSVTIAYAVKHPRRVSHLILYGAFARGEALSTDELKTVFKSLVRTSWGIGSKTLADLFVPDAEGGAAQWFSRLQRDAATPEMAARLLDTSYGVNVIDLLPEVRVPTLVMHRRGDRTAPFKLGREMASLIPKARFVPLDGDIHIPFFGDADSFLRSIAEFLGDPVDAAPTMPTAEKFMRKLTAILSADVKDYSRLMGKDEEGTLRTLKAYKEIITSFFQNHRGRVVGTAGDSVLAEFASVVDAVRCAVEIQEELKKRNSELPENRRMEFRIGVNLGDVVEEGDTIYGDGVNIAARLESLAEAGGICISGIVHDQIEKKLNLSYEYLGERSVKNIERPIQVYRILIETKTSVPT
jgi:class 3 adenylate cyclase